MRIREVSAKNFRTLKHLTIPFTENYCTISGKNNSGKSAVVKIIEHFLEDEDKRFYRDKRNIRYERDSTQWDKGQVEVHIEIEISKNDDSELYFFLDRFAPVKLTEPSVVVKLSSILDVSSSESLAFVNGDQLEKQAAAEVLKKFKGSSGLVIHNSTRPTHTYFYSGDEIVEFIESQFSDDDTKKIAEAESALQRRVRSAVKKNRDALSSYLGRLTENYQIEFAAPDGGRSRQVPLTITLSDKSVEVPLQEWGTGTQNRTRALISVFEAARARSTLAPSDRVTPVVVIEEPESFLHPSAQAEFGKILNQISNDVSVQIIVTTHSPYMMNRVSPAANVLLERRTVRGLLKETQIVETAGDNWMRPFSESLGLVPDDFSDLKELFGGEKSRVILVEGIIDRQYFEFIRENFPDVYRIPDDVEVVPFGGKDTLKNSVLIKFVLQRFDRVFLTFDLDAEKECKACLERIGLTEGDDFCSVGIARTGQACIEGLAPDHVKAKVFQDNHELVMALAGDGPERKKAKDELKLKILEEFKRATLADSDLKNFRILFTKIAKKFR